MTMRSGNCKERFFTAWVFEMLEWVEADDENASHGARGELQIPCF